MSDVICSAPVLFLIFNRSDTARQVFARIRQARPARLYLAADGPRLHKPGEDAAVAAVRQEILAGIDWPCEVRTLLRAENLGCKRAVSSAITWFFEQEPEGIVLEDDTLPSLSFFRYASELLARYRDDTRVMKIAGFNPIPGIHSCGAADYFFSHLGFIWGWASWRRAWTQYDVAMSDWPAFAGEGKTAVHPFFPDRVGLFSTTHAGKIDTWDYQWDYAQAKNSGLQIVPRVSLVRNIGFGPGATHTVRRNAEREAICAEELTFPLRAPSFVYPDVAYERAIIRAVTPPLWRRVLSKGKALVKQVAGPLLPARQG